MSDNGVGLSRDQLETLSDLLLRVSGNGADLLEGARYLLLPAGYVEASRGHRVVGSALQVLLLVHLLEESVATILSVYVYQVAIAQLVEHKTCCTQKGTVWIESHHNATR